jgi:hypothetical protein
MCTRGDPPLERKNGGGGEHSTREVAVNGGGEEQGGALGDVIVGLRGGWSRWGFGAMAKFVMLVEERRDKREVDGNLEADGWACWYQTWSFAACVVGAPDSFPSYRVPLGRAGVFTRLVMTWIFIGTIGVSSFSL